MNKADEIKDLAHEYASATELASSYLSGAGARKQADTVRDELHAAIDAQRAEIERLLRELGLSNAPLMLARAHVEMAEHEVDCLDAATSDIPQPGSRWRHKSGTEYTVHGVTNIAATKKDEYPPTVVYRSDKGEWWSRPLSRWHASMTLFLELGAEIDAQQVEIERLTARVDLDMTNNIGWRVHGMRAQGGVHNGQYITYTSCEFLGVNLQINSATHLFSCYLEDCELVLPPGVDEVTIEANFSRFNNIKVRDGKKVQFRT